MCETDTTHSNHINENDQNDDDSHICHIVCDVFEFVRTKPNARAFATKEIANEHCCMLNMEYAVMIVICSSQQMHSLSFTQAHQVITESPIAFDNDTNSSDSLMN